MSFSFLLLTFHTLIFLVITFYIHKYKKGLTPVRLVELIIDTKVRMVEFKQKLRKE